MSRFGCLLVVAGLLVSSVGCSKSESSSEPLKEAKPTGPKESFQVVLEAVKKRMKNEHPDVLSYVEPKEETENVKGPDGFANGETRKVLRPEWWYRTRWTFHIEGYDIKATDSIVTPFTAKISYFTTSESAHPIGKPDENFKDKQSAISDRVEWKDDTRNTYSRKYLSTASFNYTDGTWESKRTGWPFVEGDYDGHSSGQEVLRK